MTRTVLIAGVALLVFLVAVIETHPNIAIPPEKWTEVRMVEEHVRIALSPARVDVEGTYTLKNEGAASTLVVGYPRGILEKSLDDFTAMVDGKAVEVSSVPGKDAQRRTDFSPPKDPDKPFKNAYQFEGPYPEWKTFNVHLEKDKLHAVVVRYHVATAEVPAVDGKGLRAFIYVLRTGATWKGNIEKATVEVTLDGGLTRGDIVTMNPAPAPLAANAAPPRIVWQFRDFKPTQDIEITFKAPK